MRLQLLLAVLWISPAATAQTHASTESADTEHGTAGEPRRRGLFPRLRAKNAERRRVRLAARDAAGTQQDPATPPPSGGVWEWVERMDGEVPTEAQAAALEEHAEEEEAQAAIQEKALPKSNHPLFLDLVDPDEFDIPVEVTPEVEKWVQYFTGNGRKYYAKWLGRSTRFRPMMYRELDKAGLPRDLVYLSMIESGYNAHAYSHAAAAGLWQFIPSTARLYKMRVDWWVDDRRDPASSLDAAMAFLGELHTMFGDWRLAWAAYNTGPGRVRRASRDSGSKDFWTLARGTYLHSETDNYVPKIMAAAIIGKHPERYGFDTGITYQDELVYDISHVDGSVALEVIADCAGASLEEIKALNPALRRYATPPEGYDVRVPAGRKAKFAAALAKVPAKKRLTIARHTIRSGETLTGIANKYGVSLTDLSRANGLRNVNRITVGTTLVVPVGGDRRVAVASTPRATDASPPPARKPAPKTSVHVVQRGQTLSTIAARYGTSVSKIQRDNRISGSKILVGQRLKVAGGTGSAPAASTKHTVRKGDTLSNIASKHGVRTSDLQRWNSISNASHIRVGQVLTVRGGTAPKATTINYTVRSGDSLGKIANRNGCTVDQLVAWNRLRNTVIQPGQKLTIRK
jgi:membrane-bound lytic murein transglycosylase D